MVICERRAFVGVQTMNLLGHTCTPVGMSYQQKNEPYVSLGGPAGSSLLRWAISGQHQKPWLTTRHYRCSKTDFMIGWPVTTQHRHVTRGVSRLALAARRHCRESLSYAEPSAT